MKPRTAAIVIPVLALILAFIWRVANEKRETIEVPGIGRVQLATPEEAAYWREYYDRLAGDTGDYLH